MTEFLSDRLRFALSMHHEDRSTVILRKDRLTDRQIKRLVLISEPKQALFGDICDIEVALKVLTA